MGFLIALWANPLVRKVLLYVAIAAAAAYGLKLWLNRHDARIYQEGKEAMAVEMEKAKREEWAAKEKTLAEKYLSVQAATEQLTKDRMDLYRSLNARLQAVKTATAHAPDAVVAIPDSQLDGAIRAISRQLASQP